MKKIYLSLCVPIFLWAGPPVKSNDPLIPAKGEYEINFGFSTEYRETKLIQFPIIDANYGLAENLEVTLVSAYNYGSHDHGFDALEIAMKWVAYSGDFFAMAIAPAYFSSPIDSVYYIGETYRMAIPMSFTLTPHLNFVMDLIYLNPKSDLEHFELGAFLRYSKDKYEYFLEGFSDEISSQTTVPLLLTIGYTYAINKKMVFLISYGEEVVTQTTKAKRFYSGLRLFF